MQNILKLTNKISKSIVKPSVSFFNGTNTSCTHFSSKVTNFPKYKLIYFDVRAVGEPIRLIFAYAKVPYEDKRIPFKEWPAIKKSMPLEKIPVLFEDDKEITQSGAIARYLGKKYGLVPTDDFEAVRCDEVMEMLNDIMTVWRYLRAEKEPENKAKILEKLMSGIMPLSLARIENFVKANGGKNIAGSKTTWADLSLAHYLEMYELTLDKQLLNNYPALKKFQQHVYSLPEIQDWLKNRPEFYVA